MHLMDPDDFATWLISLKPGDYVEWSELEQKLLK